MRAPWLPNPRCCDTDQIAHMCRKCKNALSEKLNEVAANMAASTTHNVQQPAPLVLGGWQAIFNESREERDDETIVVNGNGSGPAPLVFDKIDWSKDGTDATRNQEPGVLYAPSGPAPLVFDRPEW